MLFRSSVFFSLFASSEIYSWTVTISALRKEEYGKMYHKYMFVMLVASIMARETLQCRYVLQCGAEETVVAEVKAECDRGHGYIVTQTYKCPKGHGTTKEEVAKRCPFC